MAPNAPMPRPRVRREPPPLDQLPAWGDLVQVMDTPAAEDPVATRQQGVAKVRTEEPGAPGDHHPGQQRPMPT